MNQAIPFRHLYHLSGAGNDFLAAVAETISFDPKRVSALCQRGVGLGADGFFVLERLDSRQARLHHWNPDGSRAALCVNGTRCAVRLAGELGWIATDQPLVLETDSGTATGALLAAPGQARVEFPWQIAPPQAVELGEGRAWLIRVGVPHLLLLHPAPLDGAPVASLGPVLRRHPALGSEGANVSWVRFPEPTILEIRTFERGVERETLACGSAVLAALVLGQTLGQLSQNATARVAGGFPLVAHRSPGASLSLAGDARLLARLELVGDALLPLPNPNFVA